MKRNAIFFSGAIVKKKKKKKEKKTVHSTNEDWSWKISPSLCWTLRNWFVLYFNFLSLIVTYSSQFTWQGQRKLQWAMSKDEPLLSNCPLETAEPSCNHARVPGYKKKYKKKKTRKRREKREVLQNEIRMQVFVKLGLRPHESSDGPANRRVVLQIENWSFCSRTVDVMAAHGVWSLDRSVNLAS